MCGICGYISKKDIHEKAFELMIDSMYHRGPDDSGMWKCYQQECYIALGHRRLSILDCSYNGHQPMYDSTGRYCIVFNGEIYNFEEIRDQLKEFRMVSSSDTEVLLYAYVKYGIKCLDYLNGMFAFAIFDKEENSLFLARDRMGEKPLFYYYDDNSFVFASELKAIVNYPYFSKKINPEVLVQYFSQNTILPPNTIYKDTYKLKAGEYILWKKGNLSKGVYYSPIDSYYANKDNELTEYAICKKQLKELLYDSIEKRLVADVPVGTFLSGGIDSTLVTAIANDIKSDNKVDAFTIGFDDSNYDESSFAENSAKYLGVRHHKQIMRENDALEMLTDICKYYDEPFSDSSQLPTMLVSKFTRQNVTVALSGDGGDELFAGYSNIDTISRLHKYSKVLDLARAVVPSLISDNCNSDMVRILLGKKCGQERIQYYAKIRERIAQDILICNDYPGTVRNELIKNENWLQQRMLFDMTSYLPDEIMTKTDRASMRFSLEMRCPLLDHRIVDFSMKVPLEYKYKDGIKKYILKDILYDYIPKEMLDRPKRGFGVPIYKWLNSSLNEQLIGYIDKRFVEEQGLFDYDHLMKLYRIFRKAKQTSSTQIMWSYFMFQKWYTEFIV